MAMGSLSAFSSNADSGRCRLQKFPALSDITLPLPVVVVIS